MISRGRAPRSSTSGRADPVSRAIPPARHHERSHTVTGPDAGTPRRKATRHHKPPGTSITHSHTDFDESLLPESILGMPTHGYVITWLRANAKIRGVIAMPEELLKTTRQGRHSRKGLRAARENTPPKASDRWPVFMAEAKWCGHDSRGKPTYRKNSSGEWELLDDIPLITQRFFDTFGTAENLWRS